MYLILEKITNSSISFRINTDTLAHRRSRIFMSFIYLFKNSIAILRSGNGLPTVGQSMSDNNMIVLLLLLENIYYNINRKFIVAGRSFPLLLTCLSIVTSLADASNNAIHTKVKYSCKLFNRLTH